MAFKKIDVSPATKKKAAQEFLKLKTKTVAERNERVQAIIAKYDLGCHPATVRNWAKKLEATGSV